MRPAGPVRVCRDTELPEGQRVLKEVFGRSVMLLRHGGKVFCVDAQCSHMGGPLGEQGDIEDIDGASCIKCPWHGFRFDLETGCQVEKGLCPGELLRTEPRQRVFPVYNGGDGFIWVDLKAPGHMASDAYNVTPEASPPKAVAAPQQQHQGWGLGFDEFEISSSQESVQTQGTVYGSPPQPLTPFAGTSRKALAPSPVKGSPQQINFPGRRPTAAAMRRAKATQAIRSSTYAPPSAAASASAAEPKRQRQATLTDLFGRQPQRQAVAAQLVDDMDMS